MGWNDHMEVRETECLKCGEVADWEYWDSVGVARYSGAIGAKLGVDPGRSGKCPHCGSTEGQIIDPDDEEEWLC